MPRLTRFAPRLALAPWLALMLSACGGPAPSAPAATTMAPANPAAAAGASRHVAAVGRTLRVDHTRHLVERGVQKAFGTVPLQVGSVTGTAYDNVGRKIAFPALAGAARGRYGWKYARITPATASSWTGDAGAPGEAFFLDSRGGTTDNAGSWVITEKDGSHQTGGTRTEFSSRTDVVQFDPAKVAYLDLGNTGGTYQISAAWGAPETGFPGAFLVYTRLDGVRDMAVATPDAPVAIQARGYVYAFFVTANGEQPASDLTLTVAAR